MTEVVKQGGACGAARNMGMMRVSASRYSVLSARQERSALAYEFARSVNVTDDFSWRLIIKNGFASNLTASVDAGDFRCRYRKPIIALFTADRILAKIRNVCRQARL